MAILIYNYFSSKLAIVFMIIFLLNMAIFILNYFSSKYGDSDL